jgi:class III poly(R)-hydroxyalkanoic acid synthase PhaE subunit
MNQEPRPPSAPEPLLAAWIKWTMDFWETLAQMGPRQTGTALPSGALPHGIKSPLHEYSRLALRMWEAFFSLLTEPRTVDAVFRGIKAPSEMILQMAQTGWGGYFHLHQQWLEGGGRVEAPGLEDLGQDFLTAWAEKYEEQFKQLVNLAQTGLLSIPQEKISQGVARFGQYQAAMTEFMNLLYLPLKKSLQVMDENLEKIAHEGELSEDFKEYYRMWLRILEGEYMTLFKSQEYRRTLSYTLNALEDFTAAKQELLADTLKILALPTVQEMDEIYQEIYLLKKRVKDLERKLAKLGPAA